MVISTGNVYPVDSSVFTDSPDEGVKVNDELIPMFKSLLSYYRIVHFCYRELRPVKHVF